MGVRWSIGGLLLLLLAVLRLLVRVEEEVPIAMSDDIETVAITERRVTDAPEEGAIVPSLIATAEVVVRQGFYLDEPVETTSVDSLDLHK